MQTFMIVDILYEFVVITWYDKNVRTGMSGKVISGPYFGNTLTWRITGINTVSFFLYVYICMSYTCVILVNKHLCRRLRWQLKTFWLKEVWHLLTVR